MFCLSILADGPLGSFRMGIEELRAQIDELDTEIIRLLNRRAEAAGQIGSLKQRSEAGIYVPEREEIVLRRVNEANKGPLPSEAVRAIYTEVISACRALERRPRVAYLGPEGTFTFLGAKARFGSSADLLSFSTIPAVFMAVTRNEAEYGVVPIENSSEGGIGETLDALIDTPLKVCGEVQIPVHHCLMAKCELGDVRRVYSKVQVFEQCGEWLAGNMPRVELREAESTSRAAQRAGDEEGAAAIGHEEVARKHGLRILARNIEEDPRNATRFFVLGRTLARRTGKDKTSILCFVKDEVGALIHILQPFAEHKLNLSRIESRPSKRRVWDYCFFIDFEGHVEDKSVSAALDAVRRACKEMKVLGSYPIANTVTEVY
jgi:chorismate mutase / prephenate dehydratase